jgi:L-lysine 2,3-aminomutase
LKGKCEQLSAANLPKNMMNSFPKALQIDNNTSWQQLLSHTINDPEQLIKLLELPHDYLQGAQTGDAEFSLKVPTPYLNKIKKRGYKRSPFASNTAH